MGGNRRKESTKFSTSQQAYNFGGVNSFNNAGYVSQPHSYMPSYNHSGWGTHDNLSYGRPIMQSQGSSSSNYQEKFRQPSDGELFLALKEEIKRDNEALEMKLPIIKSKMDANMIANIGTNLKNINREMYAVMERTIRLAEELEKLQKEQSLRQLLSDTKNDSIRESESISLSLEEELSSPTLDENKNTIECEKMPLVLKGELQDPSLVENNELAIDEELLLKEKQVENRNLELIVENVLVEVEDCHFPINSLTFGMEEN